MPTFFLPKAKRPSKIDFFVANPSRVETRLKKKVERARQSGGGRKKNRNNAPLDMRIEVFDKEGEKLQLKVLLTD